MSSFNEIYNKPRYKNVFEEIKTKENPYKKK